MGAGAAGSEGVTTSERSRVGIRGSRLAQRRSLTGLLFVLPALVPLGLFAIYPMFSALILSLTNWQLQGAPSFVGLRNYSLLVNDQQFLTCLVVTLKIAAGTAIPSCLVALGLALLLESGVRFSDWYQPLYFLPSVLPSVVTAIVWGILYQGKGVINNALGLSVGWLSDPNWALPALVLLLVWTNLGYFTIVLLAGIRDVPREYYEAALIDGASYLARVRFITLPLIAPALLFVFVVAASSALTLFAQPYLLTQGGPGDATRTLSQLIYDTAFSFINIGKASAMSFVLLLIALGIAFVQFRLTPVHEGG
jgi:multiple sugar transport system permease protein